MSETNPFEAIANRALSIDDGLHDRKTREEVVEDAVPFGLYHLDETYPAGLFMQDFFWDFRANKKHRKTTAILNLIRSFCLSENMRGRIALDILEPRADPVSYMRALVCMQATALLLVRVFDGVDNIPMRIAGKDPATGDDIEVYDTPAIHEVVDNTRGLPIFRMSPLNCYDAGRMDLAMQEEALKDARSIVKEWPIMYFGQPLKEGGTRILQVPKNYALIDDCLPYQRWKFMVDEFDVVLVVVDHLHAYNVPAGYESVERTGLHTSAAKSQLKVGMITVSQTSKSSGHTQVRGGDKGGENVSLGVLVRYSNSPRRKFELTYRFEESTHKPPPDFVAPIEPESGLILPTTVPVALGGEW